MLNLKMKIEIKFKNHLKSIIKKDFTSFINKCFNTVNLSSKYNYNWHIKLIAENLEELICGKSNRLIINMPPRNLKSICVTVAFSAWIMAHNPGKRIIIASYSQNISFRHLFDIKQILESTWYKNMFRTTKIKKGSSKSRIITTKNGFVFSTSVGGSLTGEGADYIIIDDPHNPTYIYSEKIRNKTIDWYEKTLSSRLNDRETGSIVVVMQRLHTDDLCGYLERKNDFFKILKIPIITKENIEYKTYKNSYNFRAGSVMDKRRFPTNIIEQIKTEVGADNFAAQYMQMPNKKNGIIDIEFLVLEDFSKISVFDFIVQSWDTAIKTSDESDYSVCTTWGILGDRYYLVDLFREKVTYPDLKKEVQNLINKYKPKYLIIEDKASGQQLIQDLKCGYFYNIIEQKSIADKITRVCINLDVFRNKSVVLPKNKPWVELVIKELIEFPNSKHDDIVDSVSQFLDNIKRFKTFAPSIKII